VRLETSSKLEMRWLLGLTEYIRLAERVLG
jgi:hypothetical protein